MRWILLTISLLLTGAIVIALVYTKGAEPNGGVICEASFTVDRPFLQVAVKLSDPNVSRTIIEASGCKVISTREIENKRENGVRIIVKESVVELVVQGDRRHVKMRDRTEYNAMKGFIRSRSHQITSDAVVADQWNETTITRRGPIVAGQTVEVHMKSFIKIDGVPPMFLKACSQASLDRAAAEFKRQLD